MKLRNNRRSMFFLLIILGTTTCAIVPTPALADDQAAKASDNDANAADELVGLPRDDEYYQLLRLFADTLDQIDRNYVKGVSRRELMEAAIEGMLSKLDQYSNYIAPEEVDRFKVSVEGQLEGGIGIQVQIIDDRLTVISPIVGSPAYDAGLIAGDKITAIEGESTDGITLTEAVRRMSPRAANPPRGGPGFHTLAPSRS